MPVLRWIIIGFSGVILFLALFSFEKSMEVRFLLEKLSSSLRPSITIQYLEEKSINHGSYEQSYNNFASFTGT